MSFWKKIFGGERSSKAQTGTKSGMKASTVECSKHPGNLVLFGMICTSCGRRVCRHCVRGVYQGSLMLIYCADCKPEGKPPDRPIPEVASSKVHAWVQAAQDGDERAISLLLSSGLSVDTVHESGATALYLAAQNGHAEIVKALLAAKANPNKTVGEDRFTPLVMAAYMGHAPVVRLLLNAGADVGHRIATGETAAMAASEQGHTEIVKLLSARQ